MGLPSDGQAPGAANGNAYYNDDKSSLSKDISSLANGQSSCRQRNGSMEPSASQATSERQLDSLSDADPRQRAKGKDRRPSNQQRICGKCQKHLTGQFVRALGDTYHLECFTCHVSTC